MGPIGLPGLMGPVGPGGFAGGFAGGLGFPVGGGAGVAADAGEADEEKASKVNTPPSACLALEIALLAAPPLDNLISSTGPSKPSFPQFLQHLLR